MVLLHWAASCIIYIKVVSTRLLTSKGIMYINPIDLVWLLIVKLGAVQSTYMAKFAMTSWKLKTVRSISCAFPATYRVGCMTTLHSPKSKQMLGAAGGKFWAVAISPQNVNSLFFRIALIAVACGTPVAYRVGYSTLYGWSTNVVTNREQTILHTILLAT